MNENAVIVKQLLPASVEKVWAAITEPEKMKAWYFDLPDFKAEPGNTFRFAGGPDAGPIYWHNCEVLEVQPLKLLKYSWAYEGYPGKSYVSFGLAPKNESCLLTLTHEGLESFPKENRDLASENFVEGWNQIIGVSLPQYLAGQPTAS